jgi:cytoskeletal protein CcmA (bactofilin family)
MFGKDTNRLPVVERVPLIAGGRSEYQTVLGEGASFKGTLRVEGNIRCDAKVEGTIDVTGDLYVGKSGEVHADVKASNVQVEGNVKGTIRSMGKTVLMAGARVEGDIHSESLRIEDGVFFQGNCVMGKPQTMAEIIPFDRAVNE